MTLRRRIYLSMLALILLSFLLTGATAYYNFRQQNEIYHQNRFERKEDAIKASMNYFLNQQGGYIHPDSVSTVFSDKICELSDIHNLSINLFDLHGHRMISSNFGPYPSFHPDQISPSTLISLLDGQVKTVVEAQLDSQAVMMDYWYFNDISGRPIAITNVLYKKARVNQNELNDFFINLIEVYIFLIAGAALLAFFLGNYITKSLAQIGENMKVLNLTGANQPIHWESDDEIGALVREYNRMQQALALSAERLARSERESAWREMAKQVAHEIKNPLTPMKLRIQQLLRAWNDNAEGLEQKMVDTAAAIIEQIDTLALIADEFSNFAQLPPLKRERIQVNEVINSAINIFGHNKNIPIELHTDAKTTFTVIADRTQLVRVFNNLIKNSIQSIPEGSNGKIDIFLSRDKMHCIAEIKDNGVGISPEQYPQIFAPNFTTKSKGKGLGLAMVKQMIEQIGGTVYFKSKPGEGSSFFVELPVAAQS